MTKTRNNKNRSRKAKATVRTSKPRSPQAVTAEINARKVNKALCSNTFTQEPQYCVDFTFTLNSDQDMNDPIMWLEDRMGEKEIDRLLTGSGTCILTGLRDFGFQGSKAAMTAVLKYFARSPFRIHSIHTSMVEMD
jgi:hypothetical protein